MANSGGHSPLNDAESRLLDSIDKEFLLSTLRDSIAVRSLSGSETPGQEHVASVLKILGAETDVWEIDFEDLRQHPSFSMEVGRSEGLGVVGTIGEDLGGRSLILNGHIDVVPPGDSALWTNSPWEATERSGRIYGLGSCDMKGGLACILTAIKALIDTRAELRGRVFVQSVVGEEDGGCGTLATVLRGYKADGAIVAEPTELHVAPASAGALSFRITVPGRSAHACVREEGVSAVEKFAIVHRALIELEENRNREFAHPLYERYRLAYPLSIGTVHSGSWPSSVPESLVCEGRYGVALGEDLDVARKQFEAVLNEISRTDPWLGDHPPELEWWGGQFAPASIPEDDFLVETVRVSSADVSGQESIVEGMTYGSDLRLLVKDGGTPAVLFGPGDVRNAHRPDEYVSIEDLLIAARSIALSALRFCG